MNKFGVKLEQLRNEKGLSLLQASQDLGIPQSRLSELERGIRIATPSQIDRLETFFEVETGALAALMDG